MTKQGSRKDVCLNVSIKYKRTRKSLKVGQGNVRLNIRENHITIWIGKVLSDKIDRWTFLSEKLKKYVILKEIQKKKN